MAERKPFLLRVDPDTFAALQVWAADDLRSVNGQVEFLLRRALRDADRLPGPVGAEKASRQREHERPDLEVERPGQKGTPSRPPAGIRAPPARESRRTRRWP